MELSKKLEETTKAYHPYIDQLAVNLKVFLPAAKIYVNKSGINIYLIGDQPDDLKNWLYDTLETLPEIEFPLERVEFIVYVNNAIQLVIIINPSENDVRAVDYAIESKLKFSHHRKPYNDEPLPLDHPWYTDKDYFKDKSFRWVNGQKKFD